MVTNRVMHENDKGKILIDLLFFQPVWPGIVLQTNHVLAFVTGTLDAIVKMVQYEGLAGFYKGMSTKIVQSVMAAAVLFMIKEELVKSATILVARRKKIGQAASLKV